MAERQKASGRLYRYRREFRPEARLPKEEGCEIGEVEALQKLELGMPQTKRSPGKQVPDQEIVGTQTVLRGCCQDPHNTLRGGGGGQTVGLEETREVWVVQTPSPGTPE